MPASVSKGDANDAKTAYLLKVLKTRRKCRQVGDSVVGPNQVRTSKSGHQSVLWRRDKFNVRKLFNSGFENALDSLDSCYLSGLNEVQRHLLISSRFRHTCN